jgi:AcrR family transcriptional regulator
MSTKRDHLLSVALDLFHRDGFHSVGIDRILSEAGVAKMTLYNHFPSKQELILECLRERDKQSRAYVREYAEERSSDPAEKILLLIDAVAERCGNEQQPGCLFLNACAEFGDIKNPVHATAIEHKKLFTKYIYELCQEAGFEDPEELSQQIAMLLDGVMARTSITHNNMCGATARRIGETLLAHSPRDEASAVA